MHLLLRRKKAKMENGEKTAEHMREIGKNTQFSSINQPVRNGRKKKLCNVINDIPDDAQRLVYARLWQAVKCRNKKEAISLLEKEAEELGEYGFVVQIAIEALVGKNCWTALMDIFDRVIGKPKIAADFSHHLPTDKNESPYIKGFFIP